MQKATPGKKAHANPGAFVVDACPLGHDSCEPECEYKVPWKGIPEAAGPTPGPAPEESGGSGALIAVRTFDSGPFGSGRNS